MSTQATTSWIRKSRWSPYLVGAGLGCLSWITFLFMDQSLGSSKTFVRAAALVEMLFSPSHVMENGYFARIFREAPLFDWQFLLVIGVFVGSWLARALSDDRPVITVPPTWERSFGPSKVKRYSAAFIGGILLLFGARLAGGCTSGNGISGGMQFAINGWLFVAFLFATGILTAQLLYRRGK